jgi:ERCC4-type nuclease
MSCEIPRSFNSKCLEAGKGLEESQVKIVQRWNGISPKMPIEILTYFKGYLTNLKIQELEEGEEEQKQQRYRNSNDGMFPWIERLLQTPIKDHRKYAIRTVIAPYLITTRGLD